MNSIANALGTARHTRRFVRIVALAALLGGGVSASIACSGAGADGVAPAGTADQNATGKSCADELDVQFARAFSVFDGVHSFKIPATVQGVKGLKWTASPADAVDLQANTSGTEVMITTKKEGVVTVTATSASGACGSAKLTIAKVDAELFDIGQARYANGVVLSRRRDGGAPGPADAGGGMGLAACTNCHANGGSDVEHTPTQTGGYTDSDLVDIFTKGQKPAGVPQRVMPLDKWQRIHNWTMTEDEKAGLVVYLRGLEPKSQGPVDFGGRGGWDGRKDGGTDSGR
ncbi:MAG: hypothetical protein HOO96_28400 [Polyangiaceae bacterium]|nr:hypothetical protein [Polyangiaceae bacterium]